MFSTFPFVGANLTGVIMLYIEITAWKACAYGILTRDGEVSEIERVSEANE